MVSYSLYMRSTQGMDMVILYTLHSALHVWFEIQTRKIIITRHILFYFHTWRVDVWLFYVELKVLAPSGSFWSLVVITPTTIF